MNVPLTSTAPFNPSTLALGFVGDQGLHHATAVTKEQFADLFAAYNASLWPAVLALWLASVAVSVMLLSRRRHDRWVLALLAADWIWSALAYHVAFFARINSAAWMFAALFLLQAALFVWVGIVPGRVTFAARRDSRAPMGWVLVAYSLLYPAINTAEHT